MRKQLTSTLCLIALITALFNACNEQPSASMTSINQTANSTSVQYGGYATQVKWGEYLVNSHGCKGCHTPKKRHPRE